MDANLKILQIIKFPGSNLIFMCVETAKTGSVF